MSHDGSTMRNYVHEKIHKQVVEQLQTELAQLKYLEHLVTYTNKRVIPGEKDSIDALVDYIKKLEEKCTEYEKVIGIYAKSENWNDRKFLIVDDIELRQHESNNPCGKWARKILEKWKGKE